MIILQAVVIVFYYHAPEKRHCDARDIVRARKQPLKYQVNIVRASKKRYRSLSVPVPNHSYSSLGILMCPFSKARRINLEYTGGSLYASAVTQAAR